MIARHDLHGGHHRIRLGRVEENRTRDVWLGSENPPFVIDSLGPQSGGRRKNARKNQSEPARLEIHRAPRAKAHEETTKAWDDGGNRRALGRRSGAALTRWRVC